MMDFNSATNSFTVFNFVFGQAKNTLIFNVSHNCFKTNVCVVDSKLQYALGKAFADKTQQHVHVCANSCHTCSVSFLPIGVVHNVHFSSEGWMTAIDNFVVKRPGWPIYNTSLWKSLMQLFGNNGIDCLTQVTCLGKMVLIVLPVWSLVRPPVGFYSTS